MADPSGAAGLLPAMLGQPRWHLEPGELLTALVLLAEEVLPACLEMSCWWGGGHCPCPPPSAPPGDAGPQAAAAVMESSPATKWEGSMGGF